MKKRKEKTIMDVLKLNFQQVIFTNIFLNVLFLMLGFIIYIKPYIALKTCGIILGVYFILYGIVNIYEFFLREESPIFTFNIFSGVLSVLLGIFVMLNPFHIIKILTFTLGIFLIVLAFVKFFKSLKLRQVGYQDWLMLLVISLLLLAFGIFITINPMASMDLARACSIFMILASILEICNLLMIQKNAKKIAKLFK